MPPAEEDRRLLERWEPSPLNPIRLLEDVPPRRLAAELAKLAEEAAGHPTALYTIDIGGSALCKVSGAASMPDEIEIGQGIGPELARGRISEVRELLEQQLPGAVAVPLWLYGRAAAVLVTERAPTGELETLARQAAAAVELADRYTDVFSAARRRIATTPAAEIQENILPARIVDYDGVQLAGGVVPAYSIGGDWYDHADNPDGVWMAVADAMGKGARAAALSTVTLGALRAARRSGGNLEDAARLMNEAVVELDLNEGFVTALVAHWERDRERLTWVRLGHPPPLLVNDAGVQECAAGTNMPLGILPDLGPIEIDETHLDPGDQFVMFSDGVIERRRDDGAMFGLDGVVPAVEAAGRRSAHATARSLIRAVVGAAMTPPRDDATVLVLHRA